MIDEVLTMCSRQMEHYLHHFFHQPEGLVELATIGEQGSEEPCKLVISMINLERETVQGISHASRSGGVSGYKYPVIHLNIYILIAAVYSSVRYKEALSILSQSLAFLQNTPVIQLDNGNAYPIELVAPSWQDLSNIWSAHGGHYHPSVVCKIRGFSFDADEIKRTQSGVRASQEAIY